MEKLPISLNFSKLVVTKRLTTIALRMRNFMTRYYADDDSIVLYDFYPDAYTHESKNERWTIRKLTPDSLVVYVYKNTVVLDGDTLNTSGNEIETFVRRK